MEHDMPSPVVSNLDENIINALKAKAVAHQRSMKAEHGAILADVLIRLKPTLFVEVLASMPNVGLDSYFERIHDVKECNVFD